MKPRCYFYPRSPCGERPDKRTHPGAKSEFLSTLSLRRATTGRLRRGGPHGISIHALLAESDPERWPGPRLADHFYPRSPCGERQAIRGMLDVDALFLSTLSLRRATTPGTSCASAQNYFYPRSPCGERPDGSTTINLFEQFLSTLSLRRATGPYHAGCRPTQYFYPRSPCGERPQVAAYLNSSLLFLSTLSLRRATCVRCVQPHSDRNFYPRSPCGERRQKKPA